MAIRISNCVLQACVVGISVSAGADVEVTGTRIHAKRAIEERDPPQEMPLRQWLGVRPQTPDNLVLEMLQALAAMNAGQVDRSAIKQRVEASGLMKYLGFGKTSLDVAAALLTLHESGLVRGLLASFPH